MQIQNSKSKTTMKIHHETNVLFQDDKVTKMCKFGNKDNFKIHTNSKNSCSRKELHFQLKGSRPEGALSGIS